MEKSNPFSFSKASDYTDEEINTFWVDLSNKEFIDSLIEPHLRKSKFILGGKGTGKTHLLRHYSYSTVKLREKNFQGLDLLKEKKYLGVFLRANSLDANRFQTKNQNEKTKWQTLFGIFLDLKLVDNLLEILIEIQEKSPHYYFNDHDFIESLSDEISDPNFDRISNLIELKEWVKTETKKINKAVNNYAFTERLDITPSFSLGTLSIKIKDSLNKWNSEFKDISLIYLIDEIENFSNIEQQEVIQTLIRYSEGMSTFRISGRLYAIKTYSTIGNGEENREESEFKKINLDECLKNLGADYKYFAQNFITKRLIHKKLILNESSFNIYNCFTNVNSNYYYNDFINYLEIDQKSNDFQFLKKFKRTLQEVPTIIKKQDIDSICDLLVSDFPLILQKHNILRFCKDFSIEKKPLEIAENIKLTCTQYMHNEKNEFTKSYEESYSHWNQNLLVQLCREWNKSCNYTGFETFIKMSSNNPRNLLSILSATYDLAIFNDNDFINNLPLSIEDQNKAVFNNAKFIFEQDSNYGSPSEIAKKAVIRLATVLRTARFSLNIPEVSPLLVSFNEDDLTENSKTSIQSVLNYSFCFEVKSGRPDRNTARINRKIYLNPILSPIWDLPVGRRGDLSLSTELVNAIFDQDKNEEFKVLLNRLYRRWNQPFTKSEFLQKQQDLFNND
ncbi:hypothetical protein KPE82_08140 [Acinetobacter baumannii]|uniref:ORC-CDC6 family AAA ATPase n=1 Tax=Acinetobacter baumannii TaxID=470 RepID=UPI001C0DD8F6|nr:hypothetical protein [Acinetobacter baumannii]MBU3095578.1 hypothetical protein [Acinetobacter baumannii]